MATHLGNEMILISHNIFRTEDIDLIQYGLTEELENKGTFVFTYS